VLDWRRLGKPFQRRQMPAPPNERECFFWSDRILIVSAAGILFLTLFPFHFQLHAKSDGGLFPFFHGQLEESKESGMLNAALNVLLFVPFGFGLAEKLREKGKSFVTTAAILFATGALFSYIIEVLQIYIPSRDSGWEDVMTNSSGTVAGLLAYEAFGKLALRGLRGAESALGALRPRTMVWVLLAYFAVWFGASYQLQSTTRLRGWDPNPILVLGNDTWTRPWQAWKGQVLKLELWDRALSDASAVALSTGEKPDAGTPDPIASYDLGNKDNSSGVDSFSGSLREDAMKFLPRFSWRPASTLQGDPEHRAIEGQAWLVSEAPAPQLAAQLEKSNQFSIHVVCLPSDLSETDGRIFSIGHPAAPADLALRQQANSLVFRFRTPLTATRARLDWLIPGAFAAGRASDILFTYDGASLSLFVNGRKEARPYHLGPGPALAKYIRRINPAELNAYTDVYYALIFFSAGILLGLATRHPGSVRLANLTAFGALAIAAPLLLELLLARTSGRPFLAAHVALGMVLFIAGALWVNVGRSPEHSWTAREKWADGRQSC
jgi:VanZ family protein